MSKLQRQIGLHLFPASNIFPYSSSVNVEDLDDDGDLEIIGGTAEDISVYDIKESAELGVFWNVYRGNYMRTGKFIYESLCVSGDLNIDGIINILDIVRLVNIIVDPTIMSDDEECAADLNSDGVINILDIVTLVNIIVAIAWFGVNLLNVGLHSYGFTDNVATNLFAFILIELIFILTFR